MGRFGTSGSNSAVGLQQQQRRRRILVSVLVCAFLGAVLFVNRQAPSEKLSSEAARAEDRSVLAKRLPDTNRNSHTTSTTLAEAKSAEVVRKEPLAGDPKEDDSTLSSFPVYTCRTTKGTMIVRLRPDWAPHGARRMEELLQLGFFTNMTFFRVPPLPSNPIAQFGQSSSHITARAVEQLPVIPDDPNTRPQKKGHFGYGGLGPNSRTYHMWVARADFAQFSPQLGKNVWDTSVAEVINDEGLKALDAISVVGDMKPWGNGPDTGLMANDPSFWADFPGTYLRTNFPSVDWFIECNAKKGTTS
jgi:cyclophilin family peptidyl-prolyl cis-trans isomerase